ncbi:ABC transporter substrate-binding protein [Paenibacillus sp. HB172176]|uniref:ABC transporter substrate-binding protein n=1 Tax=Paenibacillus sp. HB172176 TaxID=2493690 RepID=UPI001F107267|nr:ABC transporter substrate-binding protein [Paenibacillus sp. HB172176]
MISHRRPCCNALAVALFLSAILLGGCQGAVSEEEWSGSGIIITDSAHRQIKLKEIPERIVALGNGEADIIYALGGELSGRPEENEGFTVEAAKDVPVVGSVHTVDLEKIAMLHPDVVLGNYPINSKDAASLEGIGTQIILTEANSIADIQKQIALFGELLGKEGAAAEWNAKIDSELAEVKAAYPQQAKKVLIVYGAPGTYLAALPNSLAGNLLETAGGTNVAAQFPRLQSYPQYAQLNTERVVEADPDVVLIMTHADSDEVKDGFTKEMESNPAWNSLSAVRNGQIHVLPPALFGTNPGTRVIDAVKLLGELLKE